MPPVIISTIRTVLTSNATKVVAASAKTVALQYAMTRTQKWGQSQQKHLNNQIDGIFKHVRDRSKKDEEESTPEPEYDNVVDIAQYRP